MKPIRAVYMMTDLEGVAGVDDWDPRHRDYGNQARGVFERSAMQRLLTGEVNAAAGGLFEAGVKEVLINDAHGAGRTILPEELIPGVRVARGTDRPNWLAGFGSQFDALVQIGMHAMAFTPEACLAHTMSKGKKYRANGREVGEMQMAAYLAGHYGVPWIFTSGESHACEESEAWVPGIVTAPVKEGLSETCAVHMCPLDARDLIRARIQEAVAKAHDIEALTMAGKVTLEIWRKEPGTAHLGPGAEKVDAHTVRWSGENFWKVFNHAVYGEPDRPLPQ